MSQANYANKRRLFILAAVVLFMFTNTFSYMWSLYQPYAMDLYKLSISMASMTFSIYMVFFPIGSIISGFFAKRHSEPSILRTCFVIRTIAFILVAFVPKNMYLLIPLYISIIGGICSGMCYSTAASIALKWFPNKHSVPITAISFANGIASLVLLPIANRFLASGGFKSGILGMAVVYIIIGVFTLIVIRIPKEGYVENFYTSGNKGTHADNDGNIDFNPGQVLRQPSYYMMLISVMVAFLMYGLLSPNVVVIGKSRGIPYHSLMACIMVGYVVNSIGRLVTPNLHSIISNKMLLGLLTGLSGAAMAAAFFSKGILYLIAYIVVAMIYGAFNSIFPVFIVDYFGSKHYNTNYGLVMAGASLISLASPEILHLFEKTAGGEATSFLLSGGLSIIGIAIAAAMKKPRQLKA